MSRPATRPRLVDLDPIQVAGEVCDAVGRHVGRLAMKLSPVLTLRQGRDSLAVSSDLGVTVQDLVRWAQTGEGHPDEAWDAAQSVCAALYSQAGGEGHGVGALSGQGEADDAVGVVLLATAARITLAQDLSVTARALAALASVSKAYVNRLGAGGAVRRVRARRRPDGKPVHRGAGSVTPAAAARLLASRVVGAADARALGEAGAKVTYQCGGGRAWLQVRGDVAVALLATARGWPRRGDAWVAGESAGEAQ